LRPSESRNVGDVLETSADTLEARAMEVNVAWKTNSGRGDNVASDGKHGDPAMLQLNSAEAIKLLLITVGDQTQGIPEAKRRLSADLVLKLRGSCRCLSRS